MTAPNPSLLDHSQILKYCFDEVTGRLRTDAMASIVYPPTLEVAIDAENDSIKLGDGLGNFVSLSEIDGKQALNVNVLNSLSYKPSGLDKALKCRQVNITDTPTPIIVTPLTDAQTISIRILGKETVWFNDSSVSTTNGYPKFYLEEISADISEDISVEIYGICETGKTSRIAILEIS